MAEGNIIKFDLNRQVLCPLQRNGPSRRENATHIETPTVCPKAQLQNEDGKSMCPAKRLGIDIDRVPTGVVFGQMPDSRQKAAINALGTATIHAHKRTCADMQR